VTERLSVALCTYNGGRFLADQLSSMVAQTRRPDELVVCDDGSSDDSHDILRRFAAAAPFLVRIEVNAVRRGVVGNFDHAISLCAGEVIALADQDDVWRPEKLERLLAALDANPGAGLAFCDADVVDETLRPLGYTLWDTIRFSRAEQQRVETPDGLGVMLRRSVASGLTLAFRARFRDLIRPISANWGHDSWIAFLIAAVAPVIVVRDRLVLYRQHGANQMGAPPTLWRRLVQADRARSRRALERSAQGLLDAAERLRSASIPLADSRALDRIQEAMGHMQTRADLPAARWRRILPVTREVLAGRYRRYSDGTIRVFQDLLL
jgi:glycosyltransferase involved in cell wall biosynthesis